MARALITGITGQDGSYLAEHLLALGYEVHGTIRTTTADIGVSRIGHLVRGDDPQVQLHITDLGDSHSLMRLVETVQPQEIYNLAAQSHVRASFDQPVHTGDVTGLGAVRLLEAIRQTDTSIRYYQASSSEMYGSTPPPQSELTPFHPRSPYAVAKLYAYWATVNHRESYGIHASNGILFNHECVPSGTPVVVRRWGGFIDILPIEDVVPHRTDPRSGKRYTSDGGDLQVWDGEGWSKCTARTATWHDEEVNTIHARGGIVAATDEHVVFRADRSVVLAGAVEAGDSLWLGSQPAHSLLTSLTEDEAWLLGILAAEGYVHEDGSIRVTCHDDAVLAETELCWARAAAGTATKHDDAPSAFSGRRTPALDLVGNPAYGRMIRNELYTRDGHKRIPVRVLNAAPSVQEVFLTAYNLGDGLRAGHGTDLFKSFRTVSATLGAGLVWLARTVLGRQVSVYLQPGALGGGSSYLINLGSGRVRGAKGAHLRKPQAEVRKVERAQYTGWMFDLATESGRFVAGVGFPVIHNSPRRGREFVTRKITDAIPRLIKGEQTKLKLGNLDARRDWGHARDYVEAMHLMLQTPEPHDLVIGTGEAYSVREFLDIAFGVVHLDWNDYVEIDPRFYRPAEVDFLQCDPSQAMAILDWKPKISFVQLVEEMVLADLVAQGVEAP